MSGTTPQKDADVSSEPASIATTPSVQPTEPSPFEYSTPKTNPYTHRLAEKKMDLDAGWLGKFFGASRNAPTYIAGVLIFVLVLVEGYTAICSPENMDAVSKVLAPIITLALGYIFGKKIE